MGRHVVVTTAICVALSGCAAPPPPPVVMHPAAVTAPPPPMAAALSEAAPEAAAPPRETVTMASETGDPGAMTTGAEEPRNRDASFADEAIDYGVPPTGMIREHDFDAPTPLHIQGARTIGTLALDQMMRGASPPLVIDVIRGAQTVSLPHAVWLPDAGTGRNLDDDIQAWLDMRLSLLTGRDKSRPLVFFCASRLCWLAHNAVLRAVDLGYTNVFWYRGGRDSWRAAGLPLTPVPPPAS